MVQSCLHTRHIAIKFALSIYPIMRSNSEIGVCVHFEDGVDIVVVVCMAADDDDNAAAAAVVTVSSLDRRVRICFCFLLLLRCNVFVAGRALLFACGDADCCRLFVFSCFFSSLSRCGVIMFSFLD